MTGRERRARDPRWLQQVLARLAQIKVARAARETEEVRERWDRRGENVIENLYLERLNARKDRSSE